MIDRHQAAWSDYWRRGRSAPSGCIPARASPLEQAQRRVWSEAAQRTPHGGSALDLATGDGAVLRQLQAIRRDLELTGIDNAAELPPAPPGMVLVPRTSMERLPFAESSFDLVTSQFGIEYGNSELIAGEVARVLRFGGQILLLVHHTSGPVVAHNRDRQAALRWALSDEDFWLRARDCAGSESFGSQQAQNYFQGRVREALACFPAQRAAAEVREAVRRTLAGGVHAKPQQVLATLSELSQMVEHECCRIEALLAAARDAGGAADMVNQFAAAGLAMQAPETVSEGQGAAPFAWLIKGER